MAASSLYKSAPSLGKNVLIIGGVAVAGLIAWELYKLYKTSQRDKDAAIAPGVATDEIKLLEQTGQRKTLSDVQINQLISTLTEAMNGCGTDEDAVYNAFRKLNTDLDFLYLVKKFGVQYYQPCSITSPISFAQWKFDPKSFPVDLPTWINYDLSQSEISKLNSVLSARGISYSF